MITNYLPDSDLGAEQMLYNMLDREISIQAYRRQRAVRITEEPPALGHSPEVSRLIAEAESCGVVWKVREDGLIMVYSVAS